MSLGQNDFVQCCCSDIKICGHRGTSFFLSSSSLVIIGPCSYDLASRETAFASIVDNTILLLSCLSARYPLPESWLCKPQNSPYTINTLPQPGNMNMPSSMCFALLRNYNWNILVHFLCITRIPVDKYFTYIMIMSSPIKPPVTSKISLPFQK